MVGINSLTLAQLRVFIAVADSSSFTEAGHELEMTQSAVSHAIASLEKTIGTQLFVRGRQGAQLTPLGSKILVHARKSLKSAQAIEQEIALETGELTGTLQISSFRSAATYLIPPVIARFKEKYPKVNVLVHSIEGKLGWIERRLLDGRSDIGITALPVKENLIAWELLEDKFVVLVDRKRALPQFTWEQIETMPLILCGDDCTAPLIALWKKNGRKLNIHQRVPEDSVVISMVEHRLGYSILPRLATEPLPPTVIPCELPEPLSRRIGVAIAPEHHDSPLVSAFVDMLRDPDLLAQNSLVQRQIVSLIEPKKSSPTASHLL